MAAYCAVHGAVSGASVSRGVVRVGFGPMRRAARVDATQAEIVAALESAGASVYVIGLPVDLLVGLAGATVLVECKSLVGKRKPKPARYTDLQTKFMSGWRGGVVVTLTDAEGALALVRTMRGMA